MRIGILSPFTGWFYPEVEIGDYVKNGDLLARIEEQGTFKKIKSSFTGIIAEILNQRTPIVPNQRIITISVPPID